MFAVGLIPETPKRGPLWIVYVRNCYRDYPDTTTVIPKCLTAQFFHDEVEMLRFDSIA